MHGWGRGLLSNDITSYVPLLSPSPTFPLLSRKDKIDEVLSTGAQAVVTSCQQCVRTMTSYVKRNKIQLEVLDIVQLVRRALKKA